RKERADVELVERDTDQVPLLLRRAALQPLVEAAALHPLRGEDAAARELGHDARNAEDAMAPEDLAETALPRELAHVVAFLEHPAPRLVDESVHVAARHEERR